MLVSTFFLCFTKNYIVFPEKKTEKSDNIVLFDVMRNQEIGEDEIIAGNVHVLVIRTPQKQEPIELTYNPKLTGENTLGQQLLGNNAVQSEEGSEDTEKGGEEAEKNEQTEENANGAEVIKFKTSKIE